MRTTISGQLVLSMLCEQLSDIPDSQMLMSNTDGCEILIPKIYESLYYDICKNWELTTNLILEFEDYEKIWIRDINNYGCITTKGKIKNKGCFEVNKMIGSEPAYHKDNSFKIVAIALEKYFINDIPVETTIKNHKNIYDFCGRVKAKSNMYYKLHYVENKISKEDKQPKNVRYYISNDGGRLLKYYTDGRMSDVHVDYKTTVANKIDNSKIYNNINYSFYIRECYKVIEQIVPRQTQLFL